MNTRAYLLRVSLTLVLCPPPELLRAAYAQTDVPNISGDWQLTCTSRKGREHQLLLHIQQEGTKLSGTASGNGRSGSLSGTIQGTEVNFSGSAGERQFSFGGTLGNDAMSGYSQAGGSCSAQRR